MSAGLLLAKTGEAAKSGPIGLAVILLLVVACYFLLKSMSKHLKTVREDFPGQQTTVRGTTVRRQGSPGPPAPAGTPAPPTPPPAPPAPTAPPARPESAPTAALDPPAADT